jgi:hypothetical protein
MSLVDAATAPSNAEHIAKMVFLMPAILPNPARGRHGKTQNGDFSLSRQSVGPYMV